MKVNQCYCHSLSIGQALPEGQRAADADEPTMGPVRAAPGVGVREPEEPPQVLPAGPAVDAALPRAQRNGIHSFQAHQGNRHLNFLV